MAILRIKPPSNLDNIPEKLKIEREYESHDRTECQQKDKCRKGTITFAEVPSVHASASTPQFQVTFFSQPYFACTLSISFPPISNENFMTAACIVTTRSL